VVEHDENGWLVAPGDVDALASALERLLQDVGARARLGGAARETVVRDYSIGSHLARLQSIYGRFGVRLRAPGRSRVSGP
jgi:glycosyltransferase involved in cell wall biosynthesis